MNLLKTLHEEIKKHLEEDKAKDLTGDGKIDSEDWRAARNLAIKKSMAEKSKKKKSNKKKSK